MIDRIRMDTQVKGDTDIRAARAHLCGASGVPVCAIVNLSATW
jgi:hypothetical protein